MLVQTYVFFIFDQIKSPLFFIFFCAGKCICISLTLSRLYIVLKTRLVCS